MDTFNVVILYDEIAAGRLAMAFHTWLIGNLPDACQPELSLWRFDVAANPEIALKVNQNLAAADLILIAGHSRQACPLRFWQEPEGAGQRERPMRRAFVALLEVAREPAGPSAIRGGTAPAHGRSSTPEDF